MSQSLDCTRVTHEHADARGLAGDSDRSWLPYTAQTPPEGSVDPRYGGRERSSRSDVAALSWIVDRLYDVDGRRIRSPVPWVAARSFSYQSVNVAVSKRHCQGAQQIERLGGGGTAWSFEHRAGCLICPVG